MSCFVHHYAIGLKISYHFQIFHPSTSFLPYVMQSHPVSWCGCSFLNCHVAAPQSQHFHPILCPILRPIYSTLGSLYCLACHAKHAQRSSQSTLAFWQRRIFSGACPLLCARSGPLWRKLDRGNMNQTSAARIEWGAQEFCNNT